MNEIDYASAKVAELLEQNPENARGYYIRGSIYEVQGEFQDALADFKLSGELAQNQFNASLFAMAQTRYVNLLQRLPNEAPTDSQ
jgi:cytochrome c-type biogenesis protein CcmH/NrfG